MHTEFWLVNSWISLCGRPRRQEKNINMDLRWIGSEDQKWMKLAKIIPYGRPSY
jgi:hypothetical protein